MGSGNLVAARAGELVEAWLGRMREQFPPPSRGFLGREGDPFENPVGAAMREAATAVIGYLAGRRDLDSLASPLDRLCRIRAVQEPRAERSLSFLLDLKELLASELGTAGAPPGILRELEVRVDRVLLRAFSYWAEARERIYRVRVQAERRRTASLLRMVERTRSRETEGGPAA